MLAVNLVSEGREVPGVLGPRDVARRVAEAWSGSTDRRSAFERRRPDELREVLAPATARGRLRLATAADAALVAEWRYLSREEVFGEADGAEEVRAAETAISRGDMALSQNEAPVSMAMKSRPTRNGISVSFVHTRPALRERAYATARVAELSRLLIDSGRRYCALFVNLANGSANRMPSRIGYRPVCDCDEYAFRDVALGLAGHYR